MKRLGFIVLILFFILIGLRTYRFMTTEFSTITSGLPVTTSFYPLYFFTREIGKSKTNIKNLTPAGAEPHDYEPTTQDIKNLQNSKLVIVNGVGLEPWVDKLKVDLEKHHVELLTVADHLTTHQSNEDPNIQDPHIWLSPKRAITIVEKIKDSLTRLDPNNSSLYEKNAADLTRRLHALDALFKKNLASCKQKTVVTSHAAFGYLAQDYGFTQIAISGINPEEEPTPQKLAQIAQIASQYHIRYIFFEPLVSPSLAETMAHEVGAMTMIFNPLEGLTTQEESLGQDYFTIQQENIKNLTIALECN